MNPHQQNKVDISVSSLPFRHHLTRTFQFLWTRSLVAKPWLQSLSPDEQRLLRLYGKVPTKKDLLQNKLKVRLSLLPPHFIRLHLKYSDQTSLFRNANTSILGTMR